jgi:hypothetical protein
MVGHCAWEKNGVFVGSFLSFLITILDRAYGIKVWYYLPLGQK